VALRVSFADPRPRHTGVSHHTLTTLRVATRSPVTVPVPCVGGEEEARIRADLATPGVGDRHRLVDVAPTGVLEHLGRHGLRVTSMGRAAEEDPVLFEAAGAAAAVAVASIS
jgi:hypothetical protein